MTVVVVVLAAAVVELLRVFVSEMYRMLSGSTVMVGDRLLPVVWPGA
jgi:hypothetical protein